MNGTKKKHVDLDTGEAYPDVPEADLDALGVADSALRLGCHRCGDRVDASEYVSHLDDTHRS